jgi:hypothetical protein
VYHACLVLGECRMACISKWAPIVYDEAEKVHAAPESPNGRRSQTLWLNQEVVVQEVVDH